MASPPLEWSGALSSPAENSNPAATKLLQTLEAQWLASESIAHYQEPFEQALGEARATVTEITPPLGDLVGAIPGEYIERVRAATPFLFLSWMPIGYACILPVDSPKDLPRATLAMMHYGAAITILDDIADTDIFDDVWGRGVSDTIAEFVARHGLPGPSNVLPAIPRRARWALEYATGRLTAFRAIVGQLRGGSLLRREFEAVIRTFLESVRTCRRVRRRIREGNATEADLEAMADAVPHGMTVIMVALLGHAQRGATGGRSTREILAEADVAQRICHYQNALATLEREIDERDPSNPIVLDAMKQGRIDQRDFMEGRIAKDALLVAVEPSRAALEERLAAMERDFDKSAAGTPEGVDGRAAHRFAFGVRNLHLLYKIARGQV